MGQWFPTILYEIGRRCNPPRGWFEHCFREPGDVGLMEPLALRLGAGRSGRPAPPTV